MTDWGSHGSGDDSERLTPFVAWGAGINPIKYGILKFLLNWFIYNDFSFKSDRNNLLEFKQVIKNILIYFEILEFNLN